MDWECVEGCGYRVPEFRYNIASNGTKQYCWQCLTCGAKSNWVKKTSEPQEILESATRLDNEILHRFSAERNRKLLDELEAKKRERGAIFEEERREMKVKHAEYLESREWKRRRDRRMAINDAILGGLCEMCLDRKAVDCHHWTYARKPREWIFDLACLCRLCHEEVETQKKALRGEL